MKVFENLNVMFFVSAIYFGIVLLTIPLIKENKDVRQNMAKNVSKS